MRKARGKRCPQQVYIKVSSDDGFYECIVDVKNETTPLKALRMSVKLMVSLMTSPYTREYTKLDTSMDVSYIRTSKPKLVA